MSNVKFVSSIEVGSKWRALVHQPYGSDLSQDECVIVNSFFTNGTLLFSDNRKSLWHGNVQTWKQYFEPYVETMSKIEIGSEWKALVDEPWSSGVYLDEQVIVTHVDTKIGFLIFKDGRNFTWSGNLGRWLENFAPVEQGLSFFDYPDIDDTGNIVDNVNSPSHYGQGKIEAIEYISDFLTPEEYQGYLRGNIAKYLHRFPYKNGIEDLKKAQWYLERLIQEVE